MPLGMNMMQKLSVALQKPEFTENPDKTCRVIVEMASPKTDRLASYVEYNEGRVHREIGVIPAMVVELPYEAVKYLVLSKYIKKVWHDTKVHMMLDTAVPTVGGSVAQEMGFSGKDVTVAVIDTGIFPHPDLIYPENRIVAWNDLINDRSSPYDDNGHGTHVAGIIAGNGTSSRGKFKGMAPEAKLVGVKALEKDGTGNTSDIIAAIEWCINNQKTHNIKAINLSIGATAQDSCRQDPLCRAASAAWASGMVVCVAAGNDGPDPGTINTPAINPNVITVGNLDDKRTIDPNDDQINDSSSRGPTIDNRPKPDLVAPGTDIMSLKVGRGYRPLTGTSMSTPMVTGAVAQMLQKWPALKPDQVKSMLKKNARDLGVQPNDEGSGVLSMEGVFQEPEKSSKNSWNLNAILANLFGPNSNSGNRLGNFEPNPLAMLLLLPVALGL